ncbi:hypothetical protein HanIR_Chr14g0678801 [Helianthus annuus]|nr:hypothetical protein HanIR_Chr14g0678801 [Helianthus annuus]
MIAPLNPTKPFKSPKTAPRPCGKFVTQVTKAPVLANVCEFAPMKMNRHICQTGGLAIFPVTGSQIMKYPEKLMAAPRRSTTHGGEISLIKPDMMPTVPPKSLKVLTRLRVL